MKLKLHYPNVVKKLESNGKHIENPAITYKMLCHFYTHFRGLIMALPNVFVWSLYFDYEWPDIPRRALLLYVKKIKELLGDELGEQYMLDESYNIIVGDAPHKDLTVKYYAKKIFRFMNMLHNSYLLSEKNWCCEPQKCASRNVSNFDYLEAASSLAVTIPMDERVRHDAMHNVLTQLKSSLDESVLQNCPSIFRNNMRVKHALCCTASVYSGSESLLVLKQIHDTVYHTFNFHSNFSCVYNGHRYRLDSVLLTRIGDVKLLITIEAILCQYYGIRFEILDDENGRWQLQYIGKDNIKGCYICPSCDAHEPFPSSAKVIDVECYKRVIIESLVDKFEVNLRKEWEAAGGPIVYDLLNNETFVVHSMRQIFSAWRYVEHWKVAQLHHYYSLLQLLSSDEALQGKMMHLNIILRVCSTHTLDTITNFRREMMHPPSGSYNFPSYHLYLHTRHINHLIELNYYVHIFLSYFVFSIV